MKLRKVCILLVMEVVLIDVNAVTDVNCFVFSFFV